MLLPRFFGNRRFDTDQEKGQQFLEKPPEAIPKVVVTNLLNSWTVGTTSALNPEDFPYH